MFCSYSKPTKKVCDQMYFFSLGTEFYFSAESTQEISTVHVFILNNLPTSFLIFQIHVFLTSGSWRKNEMTHPPLFSDDHYILERHSRQTWSLERENLCKPRSGSGKPPSWIFCEIGYNNNHSEIRQIRPDILIGGVTLIVFFIKLAIVRLPLIYTNVNLSITITTGL